MSRSAKAVAAVLVIVAGLFTTSRTSAADGVPQGSRAVLESDQAWSGAFDSALMGASVASAGDVNGDGFDDVVVGAPGFDAPGGLFDEGAAYVFLGSAHGVIGNNPATAHAAIVGTNANAEFGNSVDGAGDVNGDGYDDIIVGAPLESSSNLSTAGAAYVFLGGPNGITATSPADARFKLESKQIEGHMGRTVAGPATSTTTASPMSSSLPSSTASRSSRRLPTRDLADSARHSSSSVALPELSATHRQRRTPRYCRG